jgi:hypothetical protein
MLNNDDFFRAEEIARERGGAYRIVGHNPARVSETMCIAMSRRGIHVNAKGFVYRQALIHAGEHPQIEVVRPFRSVTPTCCPEIVCLDACAQLLLESFQF